MYPAQQQQQQQQALKKARFYRLSLLCFRRGNFNVSCPAYASPSGKWLALRDFYCCVYASKRRQSPRPTRVLAQKACDSTHTSSKLSFTYYLNKVGVWSRRRYGGRRFSTSGIARFLFPARSLPADALLQQSRNGCLSFSSKNEGNTWRTAAILCPLPSAPGSHIGRMMLLNSLCSLQTGTLNRKPCWRRSV